jgi:hypothetical protein
MGEKVISIGQSNLKITYKGIDPDVYSLIPRLQLYLSIEYMLPGQPNSIDINFEMVELRIRSDGSNIYVGSFIPERRTLTLSLGQSVPIYLYVDLDHYRLAQMERIRGGKDLQMSLDLYLTVKLGTGLYPIRDTLLIRIPKSDWVEKYLSELKYKEVSMIEIPKLENPEFSDSIAKINEAWRMYSMGEYDKVLVECRKALESLENVIKGRGFKKEIIEENGEKKTVPDWEKALGHKKMGELMETFVQKLFGFLAPGAHSGKSINREDAELALMSTHALINFFINKLTA